jgi:hypothetical protein
MLRRRHTGKQTPLSVGGDRPDRSPQDHPRDGLAEEVALSFCASVGVPEPFRVRRLGPYANIRDDGSKSRETLPL